MEWESRIEQLLREEQMRFWLRRQPLVVLHNVTGETTPRQALEELRAVDPQAAMMLGEYIVLPEP